MRSEDLGQGRVIMLSGATGGIGGTLVGSLIEAGFRVSAGARDPARFLAAFPSQLGNRLAVYRHVAEDASTASSWVASTEADFGGVDGLVNIAGVLERFDLDEGDDEALDYMWAVNAKGLYSHCQGRCAGTSTGRWRAHHQCGLSVRPPSRADRYGLRDDQGRCGCLHPPYPPEALGTMAYACTVVCPSAVDTDMIAHLGKSSGGSTHPDDVARSIRYPPGPSPQRECRHVADQLSCGEHLVRLSFAGIGCFGLHLASNSAEAWIGAS